MEQAIAASLASLGGQTMGTRWSARLVMRPGADLHALHAVVSAHGGMDDDAATDYVNSLKREKRYVRDVY